MKSYLLQIPLISLNALLGSLILVYTVLTRFAYETLHEQMSETREQRNYDDLAHLKALAENAAPICRAMTRLPRREPRAMMHDGRERPTTPTLRAVRLDPPGHSDAHVYDFFHGVERSNRYPLC